MRSFVAPGQALLAEAELLHDGSGYAVVAGSISAAGKPVAEAEITYRVVPFPNETLRDADAEDRPPHRRAGGSCFDAA